MDKRFDPTVLRVLLIVAFCLSLTGVPAAGASAAVPTNRYPPLLGNDDIDNAQVISSLPFVLSGEDTTYATSAVDDPAFTVCGLAPGYATVWYAFTPATNGSLVVDTLGSNYNTVLGVWYGTRGSLGTLGCNDDVDGTPQSRLVASLTAGTTYYIEVAENAGPITSPVETHIQEPLKGIGILMNLNVRWMSRLSLRSVGAHDGWILEGTEASTKGFSLDRTSETLILGDGVADKQYRTILSFRTGVLPDDAVITKVQVNIRRPNSNFLVGSNPFSILGGLAIDMRKPYFGYDVVLRAADFQAVPDRKAAALFNPKPVDGWYSTIINNLGYPFINLTGTTQLRLRFQIGDNDDGLADYMRFYSGNFANVYSRPVLIVEYFEP